MKRILLVMLLLLTVGITAACQQEEDNDTKTITTTRNKEMQDARFENLTDVVILKGNTFDARFGVVALDGDELDLSSKFRVDGEPNTNKLGTYTVKYSVMGYNGTLVEATRRVTVVENYPETASADLPTASISNFALNNTDAATADGFSFDISVTDDYNTINRLEIKFVEITLDENGDPVERVLNETDNPYVLPNTNVEVDLATALQEELANVVYQDAGLVLADNEISYRIDVYVDYGQTVKTYKVLPQYDVLLASYTYEYAIPGTATIGAPTLNTAKDQFTFDVTISTADQAKLTNVVVKINDVAQTTTITNTTDNTATTDVNEEFHGIKGISHAYAATTEYVIDVYADYGDVTGGLVASYTYNPQEVPATPVATISDFTLNNEDAAKATKATFKVAVDVEDTVYTVKVTKFTVTAFNSEDAATPVTATPTATAGQFEITQTAGEFDNAYVYYVIEVLVGEDVIGEYEYTA